MFDFYFFFLHFFIAFFPPLIFEKLKTHRKANRIISKNSHSTVFDVHKLYLYTVELCAFYL